MSGQQTLGGMTWTEIAASSYRSYAAVTGGKNYAGLPMPEWDKLPPLIAAAWEAAVCQAVACAELGASPLLVGNESRWSTWRPPGFVRRLLVPVESSNLAAVGYDPGAERLYIAFSSGDVYEYFAVAAERHAALMAAPSKGSYFAQSVKTLHTTRKLSPEELEP